MDGSSCAKHAARIKHDLKIVFRSASSNVARESIPVDFFQHQVTDQKIRACLTSGAHNSARICRHHDAQRFVEKHRMPISTRLRPKRLPRSCRTYFSNGTSSKYLIASTSLSTQKSSPWQSATVHVQAEENGIIALSNRLSNDKSV